MTEPIEKRKLVLEYAQLAFKDKKAELAPEGVLRMKTIETLLGLTAKEILGEAEHATLQS
jgi:hypothetical protein